MIFAMIVLFGQMGQVGRMSPLTPAAAVVVGGTIIGISPISSVGTLVMAAVAQEEGSEKKYPQNKLFVELFAIAFAGMLILFLLALCGAFGFICGK